MSQHSPEVLKKHLCVEELDTGGRGRVSFWGLATGHVRSLPQV